MLVNANNPNAESVAASARETARSLGLQLHILNAGSVAEIAAAFARLSEQRIGMALLGADPFFLGRRNQFVELAARHAVPAIYYERELSFRLKRFTDMFEPLTWLGLSWALVRLEQSKDEPTKHPSSKQRRPPPNNNSRRKRKQRPHTNKVSTHLSDHSLHVWTHADTPLNNNLGLRPDQCCGT